MSQQPLPNTEPRAVEVLVRDPLSPVTRKERLYLLAVSLIGIAMVRTGLVPTKIATFGVELDKPNRSALLFLLALVIIYFLAAFVIYAAADFIARREALGSARERDVERARQEDERARYETVARTLNSSVEKIHSLYAEGELQRYAQAMLYVDAANLESLGRLPPEEQNPRRRVLRKESSDKADHLTAFLEGRSTEPPARVSRTTPAQEHGASSPPKSTGGMDRAQLIALTRVFFEFLLPLLVGFYAIYALLSRALL